MRVRWSAYAGASVALAGGVVVKALAQRPNFYSAAVYLSQSSANLMIVANLMFVTACTFLLGLQKLLYGPLRPIEIEQLYEKAWFAVTETCLAMTIFRGEIGAWFLIMFFALLAGKVWAWIGEGRVEILEQQPPRDPRLFHTRIALSLALSVFFNLTMFEYVLKEVMHMARPDMMVMFGFEFAVLSIVSISTAVRYGINLAEILIVRKQKAIRVEEIRKERIQLAVREVAQDTAQPPATPGQPEPTTTEDSANIAVSTTVEATAAARRAAEEPIDDAEVEVEGWEGKGRYIFYLDLATDFFKLVVYLSFFFILLIFYGLPIHILRDVFMTCRSFFKRIGDFMRYRTATRDMNARYPDATEQDIGRDDVCIICREEMRPYVPTAAGQRANPVAERMRPKKLPCGHVLHFSCLRSWLERQQICPTCRTTVVPTSRSRNGQNAAQGADAIPGQQPHGALGDRAAARVYQFGPLRIGVGAARGNNMLEDLQQQLADGQARPGQPPNGNGPQQYGFGIRWNGLRQRNHQPQQQHPQHGAQRAIQEQLNSIHTQIEQEMNSLANLGRQVNTLRLMDGELRNIRNQRQGNANPTSSIAGVPTQGVTVTPLVASHQNVLQAGSQGLPPGLTLPEGWTMMPLQPLQGPMPQLPGQPVPLQNAFPPPGMFTMPRHGPQVAQRVPNVPGMQPPFSQNHPPTTNPTPSTPMPSSTVTSRPTSTTATAGLSASSNEGQDSTITPSTQAQPPGSNTALSTTVESHSPTAASPSIIEPSPSSSTVEDRSSASVAASNNLPTWGSTPPNTALSIPSAYLPEAQRNDEDDTDQTSNHERNATSGSTMDAEGSQPGPRNPTVEDLVEDPD